ncbi:hypothetical protein CR513_04069, partial [Mucuna pruriens]
MNCEVLECLYKCINRLNENDEFIDYIHSELPIYKRARDVFGFPARMTKRTTLIPARTPHLQNFAIKILSLTRNLLGCEHNWSTFEYIS